ncbi:MAG: response regulator [Blautia sp.]|nr:response regulator [Blautia sp.]MCM1200815.1 response regulator [Bacteroides fragilis]
MIKLIIADDEPLVQAGIKSMINWEEHGISIVGTASNGAAAYELILEHSPDIVITDVKMPVMSGLELAGKCHEEGRKLPLFIILTSYEEFNFVKEAITYQVVDYLIKLELTPEMLLETVKKAIDRIPEQQPVRTAAPLPDNLYLIREQFYTRLIFNLFESEEQFAAQVQNLNIDFSCKSFAVSYVEIKSEKLTQMSSTKQLNLYTSSLQMVSELISRYIPCHVLSLDTRHFCVIFFLKEETAKEYKALIRNTLRQVSAMLFNYYSVTIHASIGSPVNSPLQMSASYQDARQTFARVTEEMPILFLEDIASDEPLKNVFNISLFKENILKAYAEFDEKALYDTFTAIIELFDNQKAHYVQALDAASNVLYLSLSLLGNGEQLISDIFQDKNNGYRSLYEMTNVEQILEWMKLLRDGLCRSFTIHNRDYKNHIVVNVKKYINEHIEEKLTLNKVAREFNISPNYLSVLFSKNNDVGFSDYINQSKIDAARKMMADGDYKIYEIFDRLGFESAFYFSRVFKKVTGLSPRDYINQNSQ